MHLNAGPRLELEPESSLTGTFQVSLTRAVIPYRDDSDRGPTGGRIADIGLGVVTDGSDSVRAELLDLGSAETRVVDLTGPLVILGWLYPSGLRSIRRALDGFGREETERARAFTFSMAIRALNVAGFGPLTRPTVLRVGFRDICQDLDLNESTAVRFVLPGGGVTRIHFDYESVTLVARTSGTLPDRALEVSLVEAFGGRELFKGQLQDPVSAQAYHLPLPIPRSLADARRLLGRIRGGLVQLLARFEPDRYRSLRDLTDALGERDSLRSLVGRDEAPAMEAVYPQTRAVPGVH